MDDAPGGPSPIELLLLLLLLAVHFAVSFWMLLDAVRRGRGWIRWQVLLHFVFLLAPLVWSIRRRRWPVITEITRPRQRRFAALALGLVIASTVLPELRTAYLFQPARVEGMAMAPTLNDQDRLIVNKAVYVVGEPAIGDIVMLRYPLDPRKTFVQRVIAAGGDEIRIEDGVVVRNGVAVDEPYVAAPHRSHDDWGPQVVPQGSYFVLGDHRSNSADSRVWGFLDREHVLGRVRTRWWPLSAAGGV